MIRWNSHYNIDFSIDCDIRPTFHFSMVFAWMSNTRSYVYSDYCSYFARLVNPFPRVPWLWCGKFGSWQAFFMTIFILYLLFLCLQFVFVSDKHAVSNCLLKILSYISSSENTISSSRKIELSTEFWFVRCPTCCQCSQEVKLLLGV